MVRETLTSCLPPTRPTGNQTLQCAGPPRPAEPTPHPTPHLPRALCPSFLADSEPPEPSVLRRQQGRPVRLAESGPACRLVLAPIGQRL